MLDRLAAMGWIERCADPQDRRVYRISSTPDGAKLHSAAAQVVIAIERDFLSRLGASRSTELIDALDALCDPPTPLDAASRNKFARWSR